MVTVASAKVREVDDELDEAAAAAVVEDESLEPVDPQFVNGGNESVTMSKQKSVLKLKR
jgi:hypothetical protein